MISLALLRFIALSLCAGLLFVEHVRLSRRVVSRWPIWVPFAPMVLAWRRGERITAAISASLALGYGLLLLWP
ncbi:MAG: hypothetical protein Q8Q09_27540 [Deltaproteobacteria bacterium]|nr:hypothetical protein [Deltaproteobacteria bacterium]